MSEASLNEVHFEHPNSPRKQKSPPNANMIHSVHLSTIDLELHGQDPFGKPDPFEDKTMHFHNIEELLNKFLSLQRPASPVAPFASSLKYHQLQHSPKQLSLLACFYQPALHHLSVGTMCVSDTFSWFIVYRFVAYLKLVAGMVKGPMPSNSAQSTEYNKIQGSRTAILDRRFNHIKYEKNSALQLNITILPSGSSLPAHETPAIDVLDDILQSMARFLRRVSTIITNEANSDSTSPFLSRFVPPKWHINAAPIFCEIKSDLGRGGSDPSVQASFSYARFHCLKESNDFPYEWLGCSRILDDKQVFVVACLLYALRQRIEDLKGLLWNAGNTLQSVVDFTYVAPLELDPQCVTFKAIRQDTSESIFVKSVRRYGREAHEWMAEHGQAPRLIRFEALGPDYDDMNVVVMEYVVGHTLHTLYPDELPPDVRSGVESALDVLISGGFVFGDLRRPNVMLVDASYRTFGPGPSLLMVQVRPSTYSPTLYDNRGNMIQPGTGKQAEEQYHEQELAHNTP
ncbi:hypothetical protein BJV74DRAFT_796731 [Russula compacta]|nr:hypothetical protein BJV74DRAFT_796731 [Russula compacta]